MHHSLESEISDIPCASNNDEFSIFSVDSADPTGLTVEVASLANEVIYSEPNPETCRSQCVAKIEPVCY